MHAPEDAWFVEGFLLEALSLPQSEVLVSSKLEPGAVIVNEIERGALSPLTVVVVSPAFLASPWAQFANQLAMHQRIEAASDGSTTLVPVILADCELPLLSRFRVPLDFRNQEREHWEAEAARLRKKLGVQAPPVVTQLPCPYPGTRPFTADDAAHFHGRSKEVTDLLGRLRNGQRELYIIGPAGSGKSSLVAAGLVPSLRGSRARAGGSFLIHQMRPGADPAATLAGVLEATATELCETAMVWLGDAVSRLLENHPEYNRLLIFVDQLEELFTTTATSARAAFIAALRALHDDSRVSLVLTLRADFYASLMESALWANRAVQPSRVDVSPLRSDELRMAIEAPARALGVHFEPVLVERLLRDVANEPGALPLLQDTLLDLWHQRTRGLLRLAEYDAMRDGMQTRLAAMMARRDDGARDDLPPGRPELARRIPSRPVPWSVLPSVRVRWSLALVAVVVACGLAARRLWSEPAPKSWGFWRVQIDLPGERFARGAPLDLKVRTDHAGYVWMFSPDHTQPILAWPHPDDERLSLNTIEANEWRPIPQLGHDHYGIAAAASGTSTTNATEELIVIVTAEPEREAALRHLAAMRPELEIKATALAVGDWGASTKSYQVTAP